MSHRRFKFIARCTTSTSIHDAFLFRPNILHMKSVVIVFPAVSYSDSKMLQVYYCTTAVFQQYYILYPPLTNKSMFGNYLKRQCPRKVLG